MDISTTLATDLADLSNELDPGFWTDDGLESTLRDLATAVTSAVSSYLGMSVAVVVDEWTIRFATGDVTAASTSLLIPLSALSGTIDGHLRLYAATQGTLIDLAADLGHCLGITIEVLEPGPELPVPLDGMNGLSEFSAINRATGVLMAEGRTTESARAELLRLATVSNGDLHHAAHTILGSGSARDAQGVAE